MYGNSSLSRNALVPEITPWKNTGDAIAKPSDWRTASRIGWRSSSRLQCPTFAPLVLQTKHSLQPLYDRP